MVEIWHEHEEPEEVPELCLGAMSNLCATCSFEKVLFLIFFKLLFICVCVFSYCLAHGEWHHK